MGWAGLGVLLGAPLLLWWFQGESFLATTDRQPADVLVVEGWIGIEGVRAAKAEFERGGYRLLVATGGLTDNSWNSQRWNLATEAHELLLRAGMPADQVIEAPARDTASQRTFESALAVRQALAQQSLRPATVNIFTHTVHARRSRLVFAKVLGPAKVGVIAWRPQGEAIGPWWRSSKRADELVKETVGYFFELLLNSGRTSEG